MHVRRARFLIAYDMAGFHGVVETPGVRIHRIRQIEGYLGDKEMTTKLVDTVAPRYEDRNGGYLRILRPGPRQGDKGGASGKICRTPPPRRAAPRGVVDFEVDSRCQSPVLSSATGSVSRCG
jgi:hypothetical protein